jgi:hypothetical protein
LRISFFFGHFCIPLDVERKTNIRNWGLLLLSSWEKDPLIVDWKTVPSEGQFAPNSVNNIDVFDHLLSLIYLCSLDWFVWIFSIHRIVLSWIYICLDCLVCLSLLFFSLFLLNFFYQIGCKYKILILNILKEYKKSTKILEGYKPKSIKPHNRPNEYTWKIKNNKDD